MSAAHELKEAEGLLSQTLKQDMSGQMLRELVEQLTASVQQVEASLDQPHTAEEQDVLQRLAEAIRMCDTTLQRLWAKCHNRPAVL
jgi:tRNA U34 5-carboxymethylaminomethyl modifying GTPase MnmE/TrmE